ncbi:hypothetical protein SRHO_G00277580 [Serrasalmus rhombeus]
MQELKEQELIQKEKFKAIYEKWKIYVRGLRTRLKQECSEGDMYDMMDEAEKLNFEVYIWIHSLHSLLNARSCNHSDRLSESPSISSKRAETAALLAAKRAEIDMEAAIEAQRQQLKKLENQRDIDVIQARLNVYIEEESKERDGSCSLICSKVNDINPCSHPIPAQERQTVKNKTSLVQALQESLSLTCLPTPEPTLFSGDPLKFTEWSTSFKALIERRCSNPADRLFYLQSYIAGEAKSFLEGSFYRKDEEAYQQAWKRLNARYGHSFVVQQAFREKLNMWPKIGGKEYIKLREFSDFLQTCSNAMSHIKGLQVLNDCEENQKMLVKLPEWVTSRWNRYVTKQLDEGQDYPSFNEFASFIAKEARIACNPVSSLHALRHSAETPLREMKRPKANTFSTNVKTPVSSSSTSKTDLDEIRLRDTGQRPKKWSTSLQNSYIGKCICCGENHSIHKCKRLTEMSIEEKKKCIHENKLCFACLRKGHNSKDCRNRAMCGICRKSHPTPLHEDRFPAESKQSAVEESTSSLSCCVNGGEGGSTSMIVPVWISAPNAPETLAYALLDTQSSHTFVDQEVCEKLQVALEPVRLKLSTMMGKDSIVKSQRVCDLNVRGLTSDISISLPPAYTRDFIPLDCAHIPTCQTANKWKHLASIAQEIPPLMDCGVGLLIGYDCSRALIPRNVITGGDNEPYAIKTDLGWSIVGGTPQHVSPKDLTGLCHRVSVRELPPITPSSNWFPGPKFLWEREIAKNQVTSELLVGDAEVRVTQVLKTEATRQFNIQNHLSRFSKWTTAVNVIARIQRMAKRIKTTEPLNVEERRKAALIIIKLAQQDAFRE